MLEQTVTPYYQQIFINPVLQRFGNKWSPMAITALSAAFGLLFLPFLLIREPLIAVLLLLISGYFDTLDGALARFKQCVTPLGSVMDIMCDRLVEFVVIFGLYLYDPQTRAFPIILMLGSVLLCISSFLVSGIFSKNESDKSFHYSPGIMERAEAFIFFVLMVLLPHHFNFLAGLFSLLVIATTLIRLWEFSVSQK